MALRAKRFKCVLSLVNLVRPGRIVADPGALLRGSVWPFVFSVIRSLLACERFGSERMPEAMVQARSGSAIERWATANGTAITGKSATVKMAVKIAGSGDSSRNVSSITNNQMSSEAAAATPAKTAQIQANPRGARVRRNDRATP